MARPWWQTGVIYQVYPRSFADADGDGIGDLDGLLDRLDYLEWLGIDAIWLSPFYPSPNADWGYDVADYTDVHPDYGDLDGFRRLLDAAHRRGIRVIVDFVPNHTSDRHPWFLAAAESRHAPTRDWYVWHGGDEPPNNWASVFGGPAWTRTPGGDWYYHFFLEQQPDLNWRNPEVRAAMAEQMRFWLELGVDGFRLDAIGTLFEDPALPDHEAGFSFIELIDRRIDSRDPHAEEIGEMWREMFGHQRDLPEVHEVMREWRRLADQYPGTVLLGEAASPAYYGEGDDELHLVFNFPLMWTPEMTAGHVRSVLADRIAAMPPGAWLCHVLNNHDSSRSRTAFGEGELERAHLWAALVLLLPGTPVLYQGEEIGMEDLLLPIDRLRDPIGPWYHRTAIEELGREPEEVARRAARFSRDRCRTPMQWGPEPNAGFCPPGVEPWLPVHPNHGDGINVADQRADPDSLLAFYRRLIHLRRAHPALHGGDYAPIEAGSPDVLTFLRRSPGQTCLVAINLGTAPAPLGSDVGLTVDLFRDGAAGGASSYPATMVLEPGAVYVGEVAREHPPETVGEWSRVLHTDVRDLLAVGCTEDRLRDVLEGRITVDDLVNGT